MTNKPKTETKTRGRRSIAKKETPASKLIEAVKFVAVAQKKKGHSIQEKFCSFAGGWLCASDGILTAGVQVGAAVDACPQTHVLLEALGKVEEELSVIQLPDNVLAVTSGSFRGIVPCEDADSVIIPAPDAPCADVNDVLKQALLAVAPAVDDKGDATWKTAVMLQANTVVGSGGTVLLEAYHGIDLPGPLLLPKASALVVGKCKKAMTRFGFSKSSATFWFEDGSFIKTQLYDAPYPKYLKLFENFADAEFQLLPAEFFKAVKAIKNLAQTDSLWFKEGGVFSEQDEESASLYKIDILPDEMIFDPKLILLCEKYMQYVCFNEKLRWVSFYNDFVRGFVAAKGTE